MNINFAFRSYYLNNTYLETIIINLWGSDDYHSVTAPNKRSESQGKVGKVFLIATFAAFPFKT